jgi:hypothetical protein
MSVVLPFESWDGEMEAASTDVHLTARRRVGNALRRERKFSFASNTPLRG